MWHAEPMPRYQDSDKLFICKLVVCTEKDYLCIHVVETSLWEYLLGVSYYTHTYTHTIFTNIHAHVHTYNIDMHIHTHMHTQEGAMMHDVILVIRADEAHHRLVNHTLSNI